MALYLAAAISEQRPNATVFQLQGVQGYAPCRLTDLTILGVRHVQQTAYNGYRANIPAFLTASANRARISTGPYLYAPDFHLNDVVPLTMPPLFVRLREATDDKVDSLMKKTEIFKPQKISIGKESCLVYTRPEVGLAQKFESYHDGRIKARPGELTPQNYLLSHKLLNWAGLFLRTQTYSAKLKEVPIPGDDEDEEMEGNEEKVESIVEGMTFDENTVCGVEGLAPIESHYSLDLPGPIREAVDAAKAYTSSDARSNEAAVAREALRRLAPTLSTEPLSYTFTTQVPMQTTFAKPSPYPIEINCGPVSKLPESPGIVFPYFPRMIIPNAQTLPSLLTSIDFHRLLTDDQARFPGAMRDFMIQLARLSDTEYGALLSHLYQGIRLALECQARLFVFVQSKEYLGFALLGSAFSVWVNGREFVPESVKKVSAAALRLSSHDAALDSICSVLNSCPSFEGVEAEVIFPDGIGSSSMLQKEIWKRKISKEDGSKLDSLLRKLRFQENFLELTPTNLCKVLVVAAEGDTAVDGFLQDRPVYLVWDRKYSSALPRALAAFGPEVPSPINSRGLEYPISKLKERKPDDVKEMAKMVEEAKKNILVTFDLATKDMPKSIIFSKKAYVVSLEDWKVFESRRVIKMDVKERAAVHRCLVVSSAVQSSFVWRALGYYLYHQSASSKRKGADDKEEGSSSGKKKAKNIDDLLSAF